MVRSSHRSAIVEPGQIPTLLVDGVEYEIQTHHLEASLMEIVIPKDWRLWKPSECYKLWEDEFLRKEFDLEETCFFTQQPLQRYNGIYAARFVSQINAAFLYCNWNPSYKSPEIGVRFARERRPDNSK